MNTEENSTDYFSGDLRIPDEIIDTAGEKTAGTEAYNENFTDIQ